MEVQKRIPDLPVSPETIRAISSLSPARSLGALLLEWLIIIASIELHLHYHNPLVFFFVWLMIGSRMYGLYSLLHDGMHYLLHPNRKVNDWICRLFIAWPLFLSLERVRNAHMAHHKYLKTDGDPESVHLNYEEFHFPKTRTSLALIFLKDLTGINFVYYRLKKVVNFLSGKTQPSKYPNFDPRAIIFYVSILALFVYMNWEVKFLIYWVVPYATLYQALNRLRLSTEHFHIPANKLFQTRTVNLNIVERFFFSPHNLGFHAEHHLYPAVPFYRLRSLHRMLVETRQFNENVIVDRSYFSVLKNYLK